MSSITINGVNSYSRFGALLVKRNISPPPIRTRFEEIPYLDGFIDLSRTDGKLHFSGRTLEYTFEFLETSVTELRSKLSAFESWLYSLPSGCEIYDEDIPNKYFVASLRECREDAEGRHCAVTVSFSAAPFMQSSSGTRTKLLSSFINVANGGAAVAVVVSGTSIRLAEMIRDSNSFYEHQFQANPSDKQAYLRLNPLSRVAECAGGVRLSSQLPLPNVTGKWSGGNAFWYYGEDDHEVLFTADRRIVNNPGESEYVPAVDLSELPDIQTGILAAAVSVPDLTHFKVESDAPVSVCVNGSKASADGFALSQGFNAIDIDGVDGEPYSLLYDSTSEVI